MNERWHILWRPLFAFEGHAANVGLAILMAVVLLVLGIFSWLSIRRLAEGRKRSVLLGLRVWSGVLLFLLFLNPSVEWQKGEEDPAPIAVLLDDSQSMSLSAGGQSRFALGLNWLQAQHALLRSAAGAAGVWKFRVGTDLIPMSEEEIAKATTTGPKSVKTDLDGALRALGRSLPSGRTLWGGVVLVTDGVDTDGFQLDPKEWKHGPIWIVQPGPKKPVRDLRIGNIFTDELAFVKTPFWLEAEIEQQDLPAKRRTLLLRENGELISSQDVEFGNGVESQEESRRARFRVVPKRMGPAVYTVEVAAEAGEEIVENNRRSVLVQVIRDKTRVLHVSGHPSWDQKFLRLALKNDPNIDLISFYILRGREDLLYDVAEDELSLIPFPHQELFGKELETFDLVIFQDFTSEPFFPSFYLRNLESYVSKGGALFVFGGKQALTAGGYAATPLDAMLSHHLLLAGNDWQSSGEALRLTDVGKRHPVTRLDPNSIENERIWRSLGDVSKINRLGSSRSGSVVLLEAGSQPLLTARQVEKGRTMLLATDNSWRWSMGRVANGSTNEAYLTFVRNAIRWLTGDPTENLVTVEAAPGQSNQNVIDLQVRARERNYLPRRNAPLKQIVRSLETGNVLEESQGKTDGEGRFEGAFTARGAGFYGFEVSVQLGDGEWTQGSTVVQVVGSQAEWERPSIDLSVLTDLVRSSNGSITELPDSGKFQGKPRSTFRVVGQRESKLNHHPFVLALLIFLWGLEWLLRRQWGLT